MVNEIIDLNKMPAVALILYREIAGNDFSMLRIHSSGKTSQVVAMLAGAMEGDQVVRAVFFAAIDEFQARQKHDQEKKHRRSKKQSQQINLF